MSEHNHTPWPQHERSLTTHGYKAKFTSDTPKIMKETLNCPACKSERHPLEALADLRLTGGPTDLSQAIDEHLYGTTPEEP
jgi:hypothetical protein